MQFTWKLGEKLEAEKMQREAWQIKHGWVELESMKVSKKGQK